MSDAVSKLYAEIGFKVNKQQLDNAKKVLEDFASRLSSINASASKIVSDISKSELKNTEETQKNIVYIDKRAYAQRINNLKIYARQATNIWRDLKKIALFPLNTAAKTIRTAQTLYKYMEPSLQKSYDFRKFAFESGMSLSDFQRQERAFNTLGIKMSVQDLMGDLLNVQRNLTKVALNQGGVLDAYKLTDVREGAQRGDLNAVITGIQRAVAENRIDESMLVQLMGMFGFGNPQEWAMRFRMNPADDARTKSTQITREQNKEIEEAVIQMAQLTKSFDILRDNITASVSPAFKRFTEGLKGYFEELSLSFKRGDFDSVIRELESYANGFLNDFKALKKEDFQRFAKNVSEIAKKLLQAAEIFYKIMSWIGGKFGIIPTPETPSISNNSPNGFVRFLESIGILERKGGEGTMSDKVDRFTRKPIETRGIVYNYTDNRQQVNTFEGLDSEEQADKLKDILDEYYNKKDVNFGIANDLSIVMSGSAGSSSDGSW